MVNDVNTKTELKNYLTRIYPGKSEEYIVFNVNSLLDSSSFQDRINYFHKYTNPIYDKDALISGSAIGTEVLMLKELGFKNVVGTEVTKEYISISESRFVNITGISFQFYDGKNLPFNNESFSFICSGHIIEHTSDPYNYLKEHLRVLKKGGRIFLEFPNRYNDIELHTGEKSYEWLPNVLRSLVIRSIIKNKNNSESKRHNYRSILETLKTISIWQIWIWIKLSGINNQIIDISVPAIGFVRLIIIKK